MFKKHKYQEKLEYQNIIEIEQQQQQPQKTKIKWNQKKK